MHHFNKDTQALSACLISYVTYCHVSFGLQGIFPLSPAQTLQVIDLRLDVQVTCYGFKQKFKLNILLAIL